MTAYLRPSIEPSTLQTLPSPAAQESLLAECRAVDAANAQAWECLMERFRVLRQEVAEMLDHQPARLPANHPTRVWMGKGPLQHGLSYHRRPWATILSDTIANLKHKEEAAEKAKREEERKRKEAAKPARAVLFLIKHGQITDASAVDPSSVVYRANEYARDALIAEKMAQGGPFPFSGDDSCEGCDGWDGQSRRCNCGSCRVNWTMDGDFEDFDAGRAYLYGEAN